MYQKHDHVCLKMLDMNTYIKALTLTWVRRIIKSNTKLLLFSENMDITQLLNSGPVKQLKILLGKNFLMHEKKL